MRLQLLPQPRELRRGGRREVDRLEIVEIAISRRELRLDSRQPIGVGESDLDIGGRGGYFPPLIRHSLGFGTHERGSRRLSPHPITPYQANTMGHGGAPPSLRPRPAGRGRRPAKATHKGRY